MTSSANPEHARKAKNPQVGSIIGKAWSRSRKAPAISKAGGEAELVPPQIVQAATYRFVIVKEGGSEAIVQVEAAEAALQKIAKAPECKRLTAKEADALRKGYPPPRLKKKFRPRPLLAAAERGELFETDEGGNRLVDTLQTVRAGFYLIDVPVLPGS